MNALLRNIEIYLTLAGLMVVLIAGFLATRQGASIWMTSAIAATSAGVIHGLVFWFVRRRQRVVRQATIAMVQRMLKDVVKNQLAILRLANELNHRHPGTVTPEKIDASISHISKAVDTLSSEALKTWQSRYERS